MKQPTKAFARKVALVGGDVLGRATAQRRVLPNFLILGGQRCGTTTLFKTLLQHPCVMGPTLRKGIHYFDLQPTESIDWYRSRFPTQARVERLRRRVSVQPAIGESSPYYMWHPLAPGRIAEALPAVRAFVLLRDPVERAYSAHSHERARGFETLSFEAALERENDRMAGQAERLADGSLERSIDHQHHAYLRRGEYIEQLQRIEAALGRERMFVVDSQDFWSSPEALWPAIQDFLSLPDHSVAFERHNARSRSPMSESLRTRLAEHFKPFDEQLADWWGQLPSWHR